MNNCSPITWRNLGLFSKIQNNVFWSNPWLPSASDWMIPSSNKNSRRFSHIVCNLDFFSIHDCLSVFFFHIFAKFFSFGSLRFFCFFSHAFSGIFFFVNYLVSV